MVVAVFFGGITMGGILFAFEGRIFPIYLRKAVMRMGQPNETRVERFLRFGCCGRTFEGLVGQSLHHGECIFDAVV